MIPSPPRRVGRVNTLLIVSPGANGPVNAGIRSESIALVSGCRNWANFAVGPGHIGPFTAYSMSES